MTKIDEIKQALAAATPGPWEVVNLGELHIAKGYHKNGDKHVARWIADMCFENEVEEAENDAHLISKTPEYIAYLLEDNGRLRKKLEEAQKELKLTQSEVCSVERLGLKYQSRIKELSTPRPLEEWQEDYGDVLWWDSSFSESPYCGNPLCSDWPDYHTHWTPIASPDLGQEGEGNQDDKA